MSPTTKVSPDPGKMDRRQNNQNIKAVSPRHCVAARAPGNCWFNSSAEQYVHMMIKCCLMSSDVS